MLKGTKVDGAREVDAREGGRARASIKETGAVIRPTTRIEPPKELGPTKRAGSANVRRRRRRPASGSDNASRAGEDRSRSNRSSDQGRLACLRHPPSRDTGSCRRHRPVISAIVDQGDPRRRQRQRPFGLFPAGCDRSWQSAADANSVSAPAAGGPTFASTTAAASDARIAAAWTPGRRQRQRQEQRGNRQNRQQDERIR